MLRQVPGINKELSPAAWHGYLVSPLPRLTSINSSLNQSLNQSSSSKSSEARTASDFLSPIAKIFNELKSQGGNSPQLTWQAANQHGDHQTCDSAKSVNESHNSCLNRNEQGFNFNVSNCENNRKSQLSETILKTLDISVSQTASRAPSEFDVHSVGPGEEQYFSRKSKQVSLDFGESFDEAFDLDVMKNKHGGFILNTEEKADESEQLHSHQEIDTEGTGECSVDDGVDENFILLEESQVYSLDEEDQSGKENKLNGIYNNGGRKKLRRKQKKEESEVPLVEKEANTETSGNKDGANAAKIIEQLKNYDVAILAFEEMQVQRNKETIELHKWIIKPVPNSKGVCVEGMKDNLDQFWHSSAILKRLSARRVLSNSGTVYKLVGNIIKLDALDAGYPIEVVNAFKHGFPKDWQEILQEYCNPDRIKVKTTETSRSQKKNHTKNKNFKSPNRSLTRKSGKTEPVLDTPTSSTSASDLEICTPTGQIVNIKNLNRTKCGRLVKPVLSWWVGQSITQTGDDIQVTCNTKYGEMELTALKDQVKNSKKVICRRVLVKNDTSFSKNSSPTAKKTDSYITQSSKTRAKTTNFKSKNSGKVIKEPQEDQKSQDDSTYFDVQAGVNDIIQRHREKVKSKMQPQRNTCYNNAKDSKPSNSTDDVFSVDHTKDDFGEEKLQRRIRTTKNIKLAGPDRSKCSYKTSTKTGSTSDDIQIIIGTGKGAKSNKSVDQKKSVCKRKTSSCKSKLQSSGGVDTAVESNTDMKNPAENKMEQSSEPSKDDNKSASESNLIDFGQKRITRSMNRRVTSSKSTVNNNSVLYENRSKKLEAIPASGAAENGISKMLTRNGGNLQYRTKTTIRSKRSSESGSLDGTKNMGSLDGTKNKGSLDGTKNKGSLDGTKNKGSLDGTKNKDSLDGTKNKDSLDGTKNKDSLNGTKNKDSLDGTKNKDSLDGTKNKDNFDGTKNKDNQTLGNSKSHKRKISGARSNDSKKNDGAWQKDEVQKLESAVDELHQGQSGYWETVASLVGTRSVQECQEYYYREFPHLVKKQKKESNKEKKKVTQLTGKAGTLKRKNQLRDFLDQQQEGYSEDLFDATPFRSLNKRQKLNDNTMGMNGANMKDEDGIFDELIKRRSSLHSRFQTPLVQSKNPRFLNLASEKKTPAVISNVFTPSVDLDRKAADHIIYQFKQKKGPRRLIGTQKKAPKGKKTKVSDIPNRSLFGKSAPDVLQLFQNKQNDSMEMHEDSDEEQDFYWSDQD